MVDKTAKELLQRFQSGDEEAAAELFHRYVDRLVRLARSRLSPKLTRRLDPEDVVQSACRSFFRRVRDGRYEVHRDEELWQLLAIITVNKARKATTRHMAQKRTVHVEESTRHDSVLRTVAPEALAREPSPAEAAILVEETEHIMSGLTQLQRRILQLRLQGHTVDEIANAVGCSQRTVHRGLEQAKSELQRRLDSTT